MADFKTHLTASTVMGVAYGGVAGVVFDVPISTCVLAGGLCSVSGMLPDVDSDSGKPLRESLAFGAAVVSMMAVDRLRQLSISSEALVLAGAGVYLFVRFVFGAWLKRYTVHRGMFHSLPAALIVGELAFLLASGDDVAIRLYKAGAVVLGYVSHLLLDELYSVEWYRGRLRLKKSFGTALKMYSPKKVWSNLSVYLKLGVLTYLILCEPAWMKDFRTQRADQQSPENVQQQTEQTVEEPNPESLQEQVERVAGELKDRLFR